MTHATDQARSTRDDARPFADAFAEADDAFRFGPDPGESRELSLDELGDVIALRPAAGRAERREPSERGGHAERAGRAERGGHAERGGRAERAGRAERPDLAAGPEAVSGGRDTPLPAADDDRLLTLDELGEALLRPAASADVLDFDFGTSAHERARRRTAARLDASGGSRRRVSGPATRSGPAALRLTEVAPTGRLRSSGRPAPDAEGRAAMADAAASAAERLAGSAGAQRFAADRSRAAQLDAGSSIPLLEASGTSRVDPDGRRTFEAATRPGAATAPRLRKIAPRAPRPRGGAMERLAANPDRIAMWAVLLGIVLVLIAVTSGSAGAIALPLLGLL